MIGVDQFAIPTGPNFDTVVARAYIVKNPDLWPSSGDKARNDSVGW